MRYTLRTDFPVTMPSTKTNYCWHCHAPGATKRGIRQVRYACEICGHTSGRVLIYDPNMAMSFDEQGRLVHKSCGVLITRMDGKLLLFQRSKFPYLLTLPAGHVETADRDMKARARLEMQEEIGLAPEQLWPAYQGKIVGDSCLGGADIHDWFAYVATVADDSSLALDEEGVGWGWYERALLRKSNAVQPLLYLLDQPGVQSALSRAQAASKI